MGDLAYSLGETNRSTGKGEREREKKKITPVK